MRYRLEALLAILALPFLALLFWALRLWDKAAGED